MLSMEKNLLPREYVDQFSLSQFSVPPLSWSLVKKLIRKYLGANPDSVFDSFSVQSKNAASIGQVHQATKNGKKLAVKIQYPGVADSISSDLSIVKPIALRMFNLKGQDTDKYFKEVENKLIEETDYKLELEQSQWIAERCEAIPLSKVSSLLPRVFLRQNLNHGLDGRITHIRISVAQPQDSQMNHRLGQTLWDFYMFQIHHLKKVHADPHPGNFLIDESYNLVALDFGCVKAIPDDFYYPYFELADLKIEDNHLRFQEILYDLEILRIRRYGKEVVYFTELFGRLINVLTLPFTQREFDFGDAVFWGEINSLSETLSSDQRLRKMNGNRGSKHFIYINRTFFGLYSLLNDLKGQSRYRSFPKILLTQYKLSLQINEKD